MENKEFFSKIGWYYLAGAVFTRLLRAVVGFVLGNWKPELLENMNINMIFSTILIYGIGLPLTIWLVRKIPAKTPEVHKMSFGQWLAAFAAAMGVVEVSNLLGQCITLVVGASTGNTVENVVLDAVLGVDPLIVFLSSVMIAPVMEELVFRKLLVDRVMKYGQGVAIVLSGLLFGLYHGNFNQFIYAFCLGMLLAFVYVKTGKIQYTIFIHMCINSLSGGILPFLLRMVNFEEYLRAMLLGKQQEMVSSVAEHMTGWLMIIMLALFIMCMALAGIIILIVNRKKFVVDRGEITIPQEERFQTIFLNWGMGCLCVFWIGVIVAQLFL